LSFIIRSAEFITSAVHPKGYPEIGPPEVAFAGRSNVGKSSLINCLVQRKKLVKVSQRPGRTQQINFFDINQSELMLVDLPGYGFAKVPLSVKAGWRRMVEDYLQGRPTLSCVVLILDIRREPNADDLMLMEYLRATGLKTILAVTKSDKLSNNKRNARLAKLRPALKPYDPEFVPVSAVTRLGKDRMWERILGYARDGQAQ
jgi:GTP-binding protein